MEYKPDFKTFKNKIKKEKSYVVYTSLVADLDTPVSAMLRIGENEPYSFLLESVEGGESKGRYSIIGLKPDLIWRCYGNNAEINYKPSNSLNKFIPDNKNTLDSIRSLVNNSKINLPKDLPPMASGLIGYLGFDTIKLVEKIPSNNPSTLNLPDGMFVRPKIMIIFDAVEDTMTIITPIYLNDSKENDYEKIYKKSCLLVKNIVNLLKQPIENKNLKNKNIKNNETIKSNFTEDEYLKIIKKAKKYIKEGDIFQVVPSQRFEIPFSLPPFNLYRSLRRLNPSPFLYYLNFKDFSVIGSSPEILVRVRDNKVTIRPIAGTRPRGTDFNQDSLLAQELLNDDKEIAEHRMLLDLARNDVAKVTETGSLEVTEKMIIERYSHVMHIVSNVVGIKLKDIDYLDALLSGFPAGTVSGAPKIRAMEIIDELETIKREIYGGCVGYFSSNGTMDTCITLRTAIIKDNTMFVQAGGGIVADSNPINEYQETVNKAKALFTAAKDAVRFANN
ncbi:MAG: Anthranilate synthase component 1 [Alphaproteobacteria bacterium MarineAlpha9_Bin3]|nr:MAG: Anthranilate synthase component 1 [Alphaproteobacteria bacterium MarineAlpha9_Bin3]|tara:strand:- start:29869 stop:31377 length:1509 start_codon:yes stop_codon:yes gene_type:complete